MHTDGPWVIFHADADGANDVLPAGRPGCIARDIQNDDDARLIAAAPDLLEAATLLEKAEDAHANCSECDGEEIPELCPACFPLFDDARIKRRLAIARVKP